MQNYPHPQDNPTLMHAENPTPPFFSGIILSLIIITLLANILLWGVSPGLGTAVFICIVILFLIATHPEMIRRKGFAIALGLLVITSTGFVIAPSWEGYFTAFFLILFLSGHLNHQTSTDIFSSLKGGGLNLLFSPLRWHWLMRHFQRLYPVFDSENSGKHRLGPYTYQIFVPTVLICGIFGALLISANSIMGTFFLQSIRTLHEWISHIDFPSISQIFFSLGVITICLGLIWPKITKDKKNLPQNTIFMPDTTKINQIAVIRSISILLGVNALYFAANTIDGLYLWLNQRVPAGINYSQFVHRGTYNLILTVILAALLISYLSGEKRINSSPWIKRLSLFWIAQNLFLVSSVYLRVSLYISSYQWTILRLYLIIFLMIVFFGFLWLAIRVILKRSLPWLIGRNLMTVFACIFLLQFLNTTGFIADQNVRNYLRAKSSGIDRPLDIHYLTRLGHSAIPSLLLLAENSPSHRAKVISLLGKCISKNTPLHWQSYYWRQDHHLSLGQKYLDELP